jgi:hypothetical protein
LIMSQQSWFPWFTNPATGGPGDGSVGASQSKSNEMFRYFRVQDPAVEGVCKGVLGELAVSGSASPLSVQPGAAMCYGAYWSTAVETLAVTTPSVGTTGGRVVLRTNWATFGGADEATTRLFILLNSDGNAGIPALTQVANEVWEVSLATFTITTGGVITVTDDRTFRRSTAVVDTDEIVDLAVKTAKVDNNAVTNTKFRQSSAVSVVGRSANSTGNVADIAAGANDRLLARVSNALNWVQLTLGMIPDALITGAKLVANTIGNVQLRQGSATSVIGRSANSTGNVADIAAGANDRLLARVSNALSFVQATLGMFASNFWTADATGRGKFADGIWTTAKYADDSVDDTKVGDRVAQFYRRQGGSATNWRSTGSTDYTPGAVRVQAGSNSVSGSGDKLITFPVAFSGRPLVILSPGEGLSFGDVSGLSIISITETTVRVGNSGSIAREFFWQATGPE